MSAPAYPWYDVVEGRDLCQGDILYSCPVFAPAADVGIGSLQSGATPDFKWTQRDVVVMTQTCDLLHDRVSEVLLCPAWRRIDLADRSAWDDHGMEQLRKGNRPGFHLINKCTLRGFEDDVRVIDFRRVHVLPLPFLRDFATGSGRRLRLLPPYREHLSQAFARFFMRVGLPVDIEPFEKPRVASAER